MKKILKDESGIAVITSLLIMVLVTVLGSAAIMTSTTDVKISSNFKKSTDAFYIAEGGLEVGMDFLDSNFDTTYGWTGFVNLDPSDASVTDITTPPGNDITSTVTADPTVGDGSFTLTAYDDDDGETNSDDNLKIYLRSVGNITGSPSATATLEGLVEFDQGYDSYGGKDLTSGNTNVATGKATWGS